mmetsp:Transcript_26316/g.65832  ORF Transcript_26316/g.65832 Transcript_26316/m.65832 type:complete len:205 (-) Transcript_26316:952-1566(-)
MIASMLASARMIHQRSSLGGAKREMQGAEGEPASRSSVRRTRSVTVSPKWTAGFSSSSTSGGSTSSTGLGNRRQNSATSASCAGEKERRIDMRWSASSAANSATVRTLLVREVQYLTSASVKCGIWRRVGSLSMRAWHNDCEISSEVSALDTPSLGSSMVATTSVMAVVSISVNRRISYRAGCISTGISILRTYAFTNTAFCRI